MNIQKELFDIFQNKKSDFDLYEQLRGFIEKVEHNAKGTENAKFYEVLVKLSNSINNAGYEERRSSDIALLSQESSKISSKYEEFLS